MTSSYNNIINARKNSFNKKKQCQGNFLFIRFQGNKTIALRMRPKCRSIFYKNHRQILRRRDYVMSTFILAYIYKFAEIKKVQVNKVSKGKMTNANIGLLN